MINWIEETIAFLETETSQLHSILQSFQKMKIFIIINKEMRSEFQRTRDAQML